MRRLLCSLAVLLLLAGTAATQPFNPGGVASISAGCATTVSPNPLTRRGSIAFKWAPNDLATAPGGGWPYTIQTSDCASHVTIPLGATGANAGSISVPAATTSGFGAGFIFSVGNNDTVSHTVTFPSNALDGIITTFTLPAASSSAVASIVVQSDGTIFHCIAGCGAAGGASGVASLGNATSDTTLTYSGTGTGPFTGAVTGKINLANPNTWTANQTISGASFGLSGNFSHADWGTAGIRYANSAATITDTTSTGTIANAYTDNWGGSTIAANSATIFTNYYGSYFHNPVAGTNVTFTNKFALGADSLFAAQTSEPGISNPGVAIAGQLAADQTNLATSGVGLIYSTANDGLVLQGAGDNGDVLLSQHNGGATGTCALHNGIFDCATSIKTSSDGGFIQTTNSNQTETSSFGNSRAGASAALQIQLSNDTGTVGAITLNSSLNTVGNGANSLTLNGAAGLWLQGGGINGIKINSSGLPIIMPSFTVATLPTCNAANHGAIVRVTDATAPTYNGTLTGGGAVEVPAYCNGSTWTSH